MDWINEALSTDGAGSRTEETLYAVRFAPGDPLAAEHTHIRNLLAECLSKGGGKRHAPDITSFDAGRALLEKDREAAARVVSALMPWLLALDRHVEHFRANATCDGEAFRLAKDWGEGWIPRQLLGALLIALMRRTLPLPLDTVQALAEWCANSWALSSTQHPVGAVTGAIERTVQSPLSSLWTAIVDRLATRLRQAAWHEKPFRKYVREIHGPVNGRFR